MLNRMFVPMLLAIVLAAPAWAQDSSPFGPQSTVNKDSTVSIVRYNDDDQLLDTLTVITEGTRDRRIPVNRYIEVIDAIAFPLRHVYTVGFWNMTVTEGPKTAPYTYRTGIWRTLASIPAGKSRLILHTRDGTVTDVTPSPE